MFFFGIKTTKHLDIRRDMKKKNSSVGCCIDKRQKSWGTVNSILVISLFVI